MSIRTERVSSLIKEEMSKILLHEVVLETNVFLTITEVVMSQDLKIAKVYLSIYDSTGKKETVIKELTRRKGEIRHMLGSRIRLKFTPDLLFYLDDTLDKVDSLERIFKKIRNNDT
jgi:ribosome-binding factor A